MIAREVGRVIRIQRAHYVTLPATVLRAVAWKRGDRIAVETDGQSIVMSKIHWEEQINRRLFGSAAEGRTEGG